jgi:hypothetical protein
MKKPSNKNERSQIAITATVEEPCMLQLLVETLAESHSDLGYYSKKVQPGWKAMETSSIEARVSGGINFSSDKNINTPFVTCFLFSCRKVSNGRYELTWSNSLS